MTALLYADGWIGAERQRRTDRVCEIPLTNADSFSQNQLRDAMEVTERGKQGCQMLRFEILL